MIAKLENIVMTFTVRDNDGNERKRVGVPLRKAIDNAVEGRPSILSFDNHVVDDEVVILKTDERTN